MVLIGAGGHAKSVLANMLSDGLPAPRIYDDSFGDIAFEQTILGVPLSGTVVDVPASESVLVAFGSNEQRRELSLQFSGRIALPFVSTSAHVSLRSEIGHGSVILHGSYLGPESVVGTGTIVNTRAVIDHESTVGDYCHVSVGTIIAGRVSIGSHCFIGAGATIIDRLKICSDVTIGAGATVIDSIREPGTYVGTPARRVY